MSDITTDRLAYQIKQAKETYNQWPQWMKDIAYFADLSEPVAQPVAWRIAVQEGEEWVIYGLPYRSKADAMSDARLSLARGQATIVLSRCTTEG